MSSNPFTAFVTFQEDMLSLQKRNLDATAHVLAAGEDMVAFQRKAHEAGVAGAKAWTNWIALWTPNR